MQPLVDWLLSGDVILNLYRFTSVEIFHVKIVKHFLSTVKLCLILLVLLQTHLFLDEFDLDYFLRYGPTYLVALYILLCLLTLPTGLNIMNTIEDKVDLTKIEHVLSKETKEKIKRIKAYALLYMIIHLTSLIFSLVQFLIPQEDDENSCFTYHILGKYFPTLKSVLILICRLVSAVVSFVAGVFPTYNIICGFLKFKFIAYITMDQVENINSGYEKRQHLRLDETYHKIIKGRLLYCLEHHIHYTLIGREMEKRIQILMFPFKIAGILIMISIVVYAFSLDEFWSNPQLKRLFSLGITAFLTLAGLAATGQTLEDLSFNIFETLAMVRWYHWNEKNKKIYLLFLTNALRPFKIKYSENISLNYGLALELIRSFFSAITVIYQLQQSRL